MNNEVLVKMEELALVRFGEGERESVLAELSDVMDCLDCVRQADVSGAEPMIYVQTKENVFREDEVHEFPKIDDILTNAPDELEQQFVAPPTFD